MNTMTTHFLVTLALSATLAGCGQRQAVWAEEHAAAVATATGRVAETTPAATASAAPVVTPAPDAKAASTKPAPKATNPDAPLKVKRLVVAPSVQDRQPVDAADTFEASAIERLYAFVEVENAGSDTGEIFVTFEPEHGAAHGAVKLEVGPSPGWRTWAYSRGAKKPGTWNAVVRNARGDVLATTPFEITS